MTIPRHLLDAALRHRRAGRRTGLIVRHAERYRVLDLATHESVLLTERGHEQAREAGAQLAGAALPLQVWHSPVERCAETARGLVAGAVGSGTRAELLRAVPELYAPFIKDRLRAWQIVTRVGPGFIRDWFDGKLPADVFEPRASASQGQLDVVAAHMEQAPEGALVVFVSHDWNLALVREEVLGITPERAWPDFLDGVVVALDGDEIAVEHDGRVGLRPRGAPGVSRGLAPRAAQRAEASEGEGDA